MSRTPIERRPWSEFTDAEKRWCLDALGAIAEVDPVLRARLGAGVARGDDGRGIARLFAAALGRYQSAGSN